MESLHSVNTNYYNNFALFYSVCFLDISFVVDHSGSIRHSDNNFTEDNWKLIIDFMVEVVSSTRLNIGPNKTHVGAISFGISVKLAI